MLVGEGGGPVRRRLSSAADGREEEDGDDCVDPELPGPIAGVRKKRESRRSFWPGSICSWWSATTAACGGARSVHGHGGGGSRVSCSGGKRRGGEAASGGGGSYPPEGGPGARRSEGRARERGHGARVSPVATVTRELTVGTHCQCLNSFPVFRNSSRLWTFN